MKLITIKDIMRVYGVGRPTATAWAAQSGASLAREPKARILVDQDALEAWLKKRRRREA